MHFKRAVLLTAVSACALQLAGCAYLDDGYPYAPTDSRITDRYPPRAASLSSPHYFRKAQSEKRVATPATPGINPRRAVPKAPEKRPELPKTDLPKSEPASPSTLPNLPPLPTDPTQPSHPSQPTSPDTTTPPPATQRPDAPPAAPTPPDRAGITPTQRAGGGIVAGLPKGAAGSGLANQPAVRPPSGLGSGPQSVNLGIAAQRIADAQRLFRRGNVIEARVVLEGTLGLNPSAATHELARTYDPYYLGQLTRIDSGSDPRRAATFYVDAIVHGSTTAGYDLDRLRASHPSLR